MKNRYIKWGKISERKFRDILRYFALDIEASKVATLTNLNRNTVNRYYQLIRKRITVECDRHDKFSGQIEVDESFYGGKRKGKRGRGADHKVIVFGIYKRNGTVSTQIIGNCSRRVLHAIIKGKVDIQSVIHSDKWRGYNGLVDLGYKKHYRVDHGKGEYEKAGSHINGIENFWGILKVRLTKFRGINRNQFRYHLKETEYRFNNRKNNIYKLLLKLFREQPL